MKNIIFVFISMCIFTGCGLINPPDPEYTMSGKLYRDCSQSEPFANKPLELIYMMEAGMRKERVVLGSTTTGSDGSFSMTYKTSAKSYEKVALQIPANPAFNLYAPIDIYDFKGSPNGVENLINQNFYISPKTDVKVRIKCGRVYTNQDTLYINQPLAYVNQQPVIHKIIMPKTDMILEWKKGDPTFGRVGAKYGVGLEDYKKSSSGLSGTIEYNILWFNYPTCENSPMEIVLNLP